MGWAALLPVDACRTPMCEFEMRGVADSGCCRTTRVSAHHRCASSMSMSKSTDDNAGRQNQLTNHGSQQARYSRCRFLLAGYPIKWKP
jgi:hypothetical protein